MQNTNNTLNRVTLIGCVHGQPRTIRKETTTILMLRIASGRTRHSKLGTEVDETFPVTVFGSRAESLATLTAGTRVAVDGLLRSHIHEAADGSINQIVDISAKRVVVLDAPAEAQQAVIQ